MITHAGALLVWWATSFSLLQGILGIAPFFKASPQWRKISLYAAIFQAFFALSAFGVLCYLHGVLDFSCITVFAHTHTHLPLLYRLGAVWSSSEGSMLLWCTVLSIWGGGYAYASRQATGHFLHRLPRTVGELLSLTALRTSVCGISLKQQKRDPTWQTAHPRQALGAAKASGKSTVLALLGLLNFSFWVLLLFFFDPFASFDHRPTEGLGLNPLLQDPSLMIHPLLLYAGYGGLSVPFALTLQRLLAPLSSPKNTEGEIVSWTFAAWIFLTLGLLTGSIWAYYELGWGGFWFWDPVENVALLPWLWATGVIHLGKQPDGGKSLFLFTLLAFLFVLWGTALTRSGLFLSVHSFASLPSRILPLLTVAAFWSVFSLCLWGKSLSSGALLFWKRLTREKILYGIPVFFCAMAAFIVAWGTFLPLGFASPFHVEASFYNSTLLVLGFGPFVLMPLIPFWNRLQTLVPFFLMTFALCWGILAFVTLPSLKALLCLGLSLWMGTLSLPLLRTSRQRPQGIAHIGVALCLCGISCSSFWKTEIEQPLQVGQSLPLAGHTLKLEKVVLTKGDLFDREQGVFSLDNGKISLKPERRLYHPQEVVTTETAIHTAPFRDIYVVLGDYVGPETWLIRATIHPGLWGIWGGGLLMALGGLVAFWRRRHVRPSRTP